MQETLEDFFRALRAADIPVSPAEAIDAHRADDEAVRQLLLGRDALTSRTSGRAAGVGSSQRQQPGSKPRAHARRRRGGARPAQQRRRDKRYRALRGQH